MVVLSASRRVMVSLVKPIDVGQILLTDSEDRERLPINIAHIGESFQNAFAGKSEPQTENVVVHFSTLLGPIDKLPKDKDIARVYPKDAILPVTLGQYFQALAEIERELTLGPYRPGVALVFAVGYVYSVEGELWVVGSGLSYNGDGWRIGAYPYGSVSWPIGYSIVSSDSANLRN